MVIWSYMIISTIYHPSFKLFDTNQRKHEMTRHDFDTSQQSTIVHTHLMLSLICIKFVLICVRLVLVHVTFFDLGR